jgi:hypothetical protein
MLACSIGVDAGWRVGGEQRASGAFTQAGALIRTVQNRGDDALRIAHQYVTGAHHVLLTAGAHDRISMFDRSMTSGGRTASGS